ncbi:hypothetical protein P4C99_17465 [Pontiellaceae bacterium B1224]|nr:hypothetical protein [Pontiellaceae bacterium B1224]
MTENIEQTSLTNWLVRLPYLAFIVIALWFAADPFSLLDFPLDDAWIHRVYSQSFAFGHGFEYNPGQQEAGSTSPLWSIITAPAHWIERLGTDAVTIAVKLAGVILALLSVDAVRRIGQTVSKSATAGIIAATVLALDPRLAYSALSGMETTLLLALWLGATACLIERRLLLATLLISLTPTARPEGLVVLPFFGLALLLASPRKFGLLGIIPIPMFLWSLFCKAANGHWLPTTFYVKSTSVEIGLGQFSNAWKLLGFNGPLPSLVIAALVGFTAFLFLRRNRNFQALLLLIGAPLAFLFGVLFSRDFELVGYYWLRWTDPAVMILTATATIGLGIIWTTSNGWKSKVAAGLCLLASLPHFTNSLVSWRNRLITDSRSINLITIQAGKWIDQNTEADAIIAVNDAGATRYFGKRKTIDLIGLNCADIAFHRVSEDVEPADYLAITPVWFQGSGIYENLPVCTNFSLPAEEYTITCNKLQGEIVIFKCR